MSAAVAVKQPDWMPWEDELIIKSYKSQGLSAVADQLPARSKHAVRSRAFRLGVSGRIWSEQEDQVVRRCYPDAGAEYCRRYMPWRTVLAIRSRAFALDVKRNPRKAKVSIVYGDIMLAEKLVRMRWRKEN